MNTLVEVTKIAGIPIDFKVVKGEVLYVKTSSKSSLLFDALLCRSGSKSNEGRVLDWQLEEIDKSSVQLMRKQIGFVDSEMYLDKEQSISANFKVYSDAIGLKYSKSLIVMENILKKLGISSGEKVKNLDQLSLYATRFAICMAKDPRLVVCEHLPPMSNSDLFQKTLQSIYYLALSEGITFVTSVSNGDFFKQLPGRFIEL